jgi:hypothetical protein
MGLSRTASLSLCFDFLRQLAFFPCFVFLVPLAFLAPSYDLETFSINPIFQHTQADWKLNIFESANLNEHKI